MEQEIIVSRLDKDEKRKLEHDIMEEHAGCGELFRSKYYHLDYQPTRDHKTYKCTGVELVIRRVDTEFAHDAPTEYVPFKVQRFFGLLGEAKPYKDRLESAIEHQKSVILGIEKSMDDRVAQRAKEEENRKLALEEHAKRIKKCQLKIDHTMKAIVPNAKPLALEVIRKEKEPPKNQFACNDVFEQMQRAGKY